MRNSARRWASQPKAKVAILGSSTSKDWLPRHWLGQQIGRPPADILDAHINGCHQGCTWASVQRLRQRQHRFDMVFMGTNLFQLCEYPHSKRVLQQQMQTPATAIPALFGIYASAEQPLLYMGRFLGMTLSGAYGDPLAVQSAAAREVFGPGKRGQAWRWSRPRPLSADDTPRCTYSPSAVALKRAFTEALLDDLLDISDHVYLMLLPERAMADPKDAQLQAALTAHRALHAALAEARPGVTLIDLIEGGALERNQYRDSIHLNARGVPVQQRLFAQRLKALGFKGNAP
ncbi:hypothetical protein KKF91_19665 [Myxococcota bacterium]|nr:hypothetical protein [Myxococcota bacterium]MBU1432762.1 hypothetical protein [Myxococcota bacterium]MBU1899275.1 hypothetical protein [Myxococcota bacterium]